MVGNFAYTCFTLLWLEGDTSAGLIQSEHKYPVLSCQGKFMFVVPKDLKSLPLIVPFSPQSFILHANHDLTTKFLFSCKIILDTWKSQVCMVISSRLEIKICKILGTKFMAQLGSK